MRYLILSNKEVCVQNVRTFMDLLIAVVSPFAGTEFELVLNIVMMEI